MISKFSFRTSSGVRLDIEISAWHEAMAPHDPDSATPLQLEHVIELAGKVRSLSDRAIDSGFRSTPKN